MGKRSRRHRVRLEKDQAGCMWGLISIFDFRHGRSTRKLLLDGRRGSSHPVGAEYPKPELKMLTYYEEKNLTTEDLEESGLTKADGLRTSVKELMEEEMFSEQGLKKKMNSADEQLNQLNSKNGGHIREKPKQAKKHRSKSCDLHITDLDENSSNLETPKNLDLEVILEELCRLNQKGSCLKHDWNDDVDIKSNQVYSLVEEKLDAAIKVFINQRFSNDKHLVEDEKTHHSKELMDAFQTLSSNKELFFELLQDPNSLLVKHIQCVEDAQLDKDRNTSSLLGSNLLEEEPSKPSPVELTNRKHHSFFRRRSKSQDSYSLKDNEKCQPSSRIVILKPGPATARNSGTESNVSSSVQSRQTTDNKPQSERNASQFSLNEIKRKLKHAMGKERHGISRNGKFPSELQNLKNHEKGVGEENGGWSLPNRNHFYMERFAKSPLGIKRGEKIGKSKESETTMVNETIDNPKQGVSYIYVEAKKHLSELLSSGDEKEELKNRQLPKTLGTILALPEYNFTPSGSPPKDREHSFVTAQMRLSPRSNFIMANENKWQIIQDNHAIQLSPPKQNSESQPSISDDKPDEKLQSPKSNPDIPCELNHDNSVEGTMSSTGEEKSCEVVLESIRTTNSEFQEDIQVLDVSHESSSSLFSREIQICETIEVYDEERSPKCVKLDSIEEDVFLSSPAVSPPSPSVTRKVENPETCVDRAEWSSPISVLEPLFSEEDISPSRTKSKPVATAIQPLQIHFEERVSSVIDQAVCNKESAFEYVEAVLLGSGLNWDEYLLRWLSSDQLLDPSLFNEVELFSSRSSHDQKLLFDCTDKVLKEVCDRYFGLTFVKQNIRPVPKGMNLINEVWKGVEWHFLQHPAPRSLDQLIRKDMSKPGTWMDLCFETDHIVIELEKLILEEVVEETILNFDREIMENKLSVLLDESIKDEETTISL